jgi:hypothetical protein
MVDVVRSETPQGLRIGLAVTNSPRSPKLHVLIDGKPVPGYDDVAWHSLRLSADGKHYAFVANQNGKQVCVRDGVAGPEFDKIGREEHAGLVFSPDGRHLAYAAKMNDKWHVVVDGVLGPEFDSVNGTMLTTYSKTLVKGVLQWVPYTRGGSDCPQFSPDGSHIFYLAERKTAGGVRYVFVLDGKPGPEYKGFWGTSICPNGEIAYAGTNDLDTQMVFNGIPEIPNGSSELIFSPDGKHHAYVAGKRGSEPVYAVVDGEKGDPYSLIDNLQFAPDGRVAFNTYLESSGYRVVQDGKLLPPVEKYRVARFFFSDDGKRTVYIGESSRDSGQDQAVIIDGKVAKVFPQSTLVYVSPDTQHFAYITWKKIAYGNNPTFIVLDGVEGPEMGPNYDWTTASFSPNSRHFHYIAADSHGKYTLVADQKPGPYLDGIAQRPPLFSPDGEHHAYIGRSENKWVVVFDGNIGPKLDEVDFESLVLSQSGKHVAYTARIGKEKVVVMDTTPGATFADIKPGSLVFSPDEPHLSYVANNLIEYQGRRGLTQQMVLDGVLGNACMEIGPKNMIFSPDGKHSAYVARIQFDNERVVVDGVAGPKFASILAGPTLRDDGQLEYLALDGEKLMRVTIKGFGPSPLHQQ